MSRIVPPCFSAMTILFRIGFAVVGLVVGF